MTGAFVNLAADEVTSRIRAIAEEASGGAVFVHVGEELHGFVNVGVDLRRRREAATERRKRLGRVRAALEQAGVVMVATAGAPKVAGELLGNVRVRELAPSWGDASSLAREPLARG